MYSRCISQLANRRPDHFTGSTCDEEPERAGLLSSMPLRFSGKVLEEGLRLGFLTIIQSIDYAVPFPGARIGHHFDEYLLKSEFLAKQDWSILDVPWLHVLFAQGF